MNPVPARADQSLVKAELGTFLADELHERENFSNISKKVCPYWGIFGIYIIEE